MFTWYKKLSQLDTAIEQWKSDKRNARVSSMAVNPRHFYIHNKETRTELPGRQYDGGNSFVLSGVLVPTSIIWITVSIITIYKKVTYAATNVGEKSEWGESSAVSVSQVIMGAIPGILIALFLLGVGLFLLHLYFLKLNSLTDAQTLNKFRFTPEQWYERFPRRAKKLNPNTGNIEKRYKHPYKESKAEEKKRFLKTVEKYKGNSIDEEFYAR